MEPSASSPVVQRGRILCYRMFDIGDELALEQAEELLLRARIARESLAMRPAPFRKTGGLHVAAVPLHVDLGERRIVLPDIAHSVLAHVSVNLFDYGKMSVVFEVPIRKGTPLDEIRALCQELYESSVLTKMGQEESATFSERLKPALHRHAAAAHGGGASDAAGRMESLTIVFVEELENSPLAREVAAWPGLAKLVLGETSERPLGDEQLRATMQHADGYLDDDLVVVDSSTAFVLEPSASRDIPDVLELARSMLLQLRVYDDQLDVELRQTYDELAKRGGGIGAVFSQRHRRLAHDLSARLVEAAEYSERIESSFKIVGDFYLARVYRTAVGRFGIPVVRESIARKHQQLGQVHALLKSEIELLRGHALELTIVLLIVVELVLGLSRVIK